MSIEGQKVKLDNIFLIYFKSNLVIYVLYQITWSIRLVAWWHWNILWSVVQNDGKRRKNHGNDQGSGQDE